MFVTVVFLVQCKDGYRESTKIQISIGEFSTRQNATHSLRVTIQDTLKKCVVGQSEHFYLKGITKMSENQELLQEVSIKGIIYRHDRLNAIANRKHFEDVAEALEYAQEKSKSNRFAHRVFIHWSDNIREMIVFISGVYSHTRQGYGHAKGQLYTRGAIERRTEVESYFTH